jgi:hypothetical protein
VRLAGWDEKERFLVDTGNTGNISGDLREDLFQKLLKRGAIQKSGRNLREGASGTTVQTRGHLGALSVGPFRHRGLVFSAPCSENSLGLQYLARYVVTFDFPGGVMYLKEGKRFADRDREDASGLHFQRVGGRTVVVRVDEGSPAALGGLRAQDVILQIDGRNASEGCLQPLRQLLCAQGQRVQVRIRRGEEERDVPLTLGTSTGPEEGSESKPR